MKKLITAATIAVLGIAANAAAINWSVSNNGATDKGGTTLASGSSVYLILASYETSITSAINAGTFTSSTEGVLDVAQTNNTRGRTAEKAATSSLLTLDGEGKGVTTNFKILILDSTTVSGETYFKFSQTVPGDTYDNTADVPVPSSVTFTSTAWSAGSTWTQATGSVPEPTSGLLLLLGVAGLALKRRRA